MFAGPSGTAQMVSAPGQLRQPAGQIEVAKVVTSRVIREVPLHPPAAHNASAGHRLHPLMDLIFMDLAFLDLAFLDLAFLDLAFPYRSQP